MSSTDPATRRPAAPAGNGAGRLVALDALRGIAATLVMLFHYTTQYDRIYGHEAETAFAVPWGHYGVNLFFMISGFVIFMTLHRVKRPMDFLVSRFSRLFPAFWAAIAVTFLITSSLQLPGKMVGASTAAMNVFMIHGLVRIPHVDSVYWTLEIELLFYAWAFLLYRLGRLDRVHAFLLAALALRLGYFVAETAFGVTLSWTLSHLLILPYLAWFVCGIMLYRRLMFPDDTPRADLLVLTAAILQLGIVEGPLLGLLAAGLSVLFWLAATGRLPMLGNPVLAWLGTISYTLYLLHENIGWTAILHLERAGLAPDAAIAVAIGLALALATALTRWVERPAMAWLRRRYRERGLPALTVGKGLALASVGSVLFGGLAHAWHRAHTPLPTPKQQVAHIHRPAPTEAVPCPLAAEPRPLLVLALGQSNAGNHGQPAAAHVLPPTTFFFEGTCYQTTGPAPGATGQGASPWTVLGPRLAEATGRPVVFSVLAVEATGLRDWIEPGPLRDRVQQTLAHHRRLGFMPDLILWQQGEADARAGTTRRKYRQRLEELLAILRNQGATAPLVAALSTRCRNEGSPQVRAALADVAAVDSRLIVGPDMDRLTGTLRHDGCHFSAAGLEAAAEQWLLALAALRSPGEPPRT